MKIRIFGIIFVIMSSLYFVSCGKDVSVTPPEAPAPRGMISVTSNPKGAEIFLNGKTTGRVTPDSLTFLSPGPYDIKLRLPYFEDSFSSVYVFENQRTSLSVDYTKKPNVYGTIYCESEPKNAEIYINGQKTNFRTPTTTDNLLPGAYTVTLKAYGCRDDSAKVIVKSGKQINISITLQDTTIWVPYDKSNSGLPSNSLSSCIVDASGTIWVGTNSKGLVSFDGLQWKTYDPSNSNIPSYSITSLAGPNADMYATDKIYIGTTDGLAMESYGIFTQIKKGPFPLPDNRIKSVSVDGGGYVWIGTERGLAIWSHDYKGDHWNVYDMTNAPLSENSISDVAALPGLDRHHEAWIGTSERGVVAFFDFVNDQWQFSVSLPGPATAVAYSNYTGAWFGYSGKPGFSGGVTNVKDGVSKNFQLGSGQNRIESIRTRGNTTWVCTWEGLFIIDQAGNKTVFNADNSILPSNYIKDVAFDTHGNAWIITMMNGLVKYKIGH